jgi:hypothetical protein
LVSVKNSKVGRRGGDMFESKKNVRGSFVSHVYMSGESAEVSDS